MRFRPTVPFAPLAVAVPPAPQLRPAGRMDIEMMIGTERQVADLIGVAPRTCYRWKRNGVPLDDADRIAVALGMHPFAIWGEAWAEMIDAAVRHVDELRERHIARDRARRRSVTRANVIVNPLAHNEVMECA